MPQPRCYCGTVTSSWAPTSATRQSCARCRRARRPSLRRGCPARSGPPRGSATVRRAARAAPAQSRADPSPSRAHRCGGAPPRFPSRAPPGLIRLRVAAAGPSSAAARRRGGYVLIDPGATAAITIRGSGDIGHSLHRGDCCFKLFCDARDYIPAAVPSGAAQDSEVRYPAPAGTRGDIYLSTQIQAGRSGYVTITPLLYESFHAACVTVPTTH